MASKPSVSPPEDASELAALWASAVEAYKQRTGKDLRMAPFHNMEDVIGGTHRDLLAFRSNRHPKNSVDKVRSAFARNLGTITKILSAVQMAGDIVAIFPPAMPASVIFTAFAYVLRSFSNVSADYDKVENFFMKTHRFLDRLSILQDNMPRDAPFQRCVTRIFASQLEICAIAQEYEKEEHRVKRWLLALWDGTDKELGGAFAAMDSAIDELKLALGFSTFREARESRQEAQMDHKEMKLTMQTKFSSVTSKMQNMQQDLSSKFSALNRRIAKYMEGDRTPKTAQEEKFKILGQPNKIPEVGDWRYAAWDSMRRDLSTPQFCGWDSAWKQTRAQHREISENSVDGTCAWFVREDTHFKEWTGEEIPILWLNGHNGVGKTYLAHAAVEALSKTFKSQERTSVAYFYFKDTCSSLQSVSDGFASVAWQIANSDTKYCQQVAVDLKGKKPSDDIEVFWKRYFADRYPTNSTGRLFVVLDGLDELGEEGCHSLLEFLTRIAEDHLKISVLLISRPDLRQVLGPLDPVVIEITREKILPDITALIEHRYKSMPRLHKFPRRVRARIVKKVKSKADSMLYVEHMLLRLNYIGREDMVLNDLEQNLPDNLHSLYQLMLAECHKNRTEAQCKALKRLFAWLAFSRRPLTLSEAAALVKISVPDGSLDIEDEIIGRSSRLLDLSRTYDWEEDPDEEAKGIDGDQLQDEASFEDFNHGKSILAFPERSMRDFFRLLDVSEEGLRTTPSDAHLAIFEMATSIMMNSGQGKGSKNEDSLLEYATQFWANHFIEVDLSKATDCNVNCVLKALYHITSNTNNMASKFEDYNSPGDTYFAAFGASWIDNLLKWVERGASLDKGVLTAEVESWVRSEATCPLKVLEPLARGHVLNWCKAEPRDKIGKAFEFAYAALNVRSDPSESPGFPEIVYKVRDAFVDIVDFNEAGAERAVGATLLNFFLSEEAITHLNQGLKKMLPGESSGRFYTYWILAEAYIDAQRRDEAMAAFNEAILALPSSWKEDKELILAKKNILIHIAQYFTELGESEAAIEVYKEAGAVDLDQTIGGLNLDAMTRLLNWDIDPKGFRLVEMIRNWTETERKDWLEFVLEKPDSLYMDRFSQAAKLNGETGIKFLLDYYAEYGKTLRPRSCRKIFFQAHLADIYNMVIRDGRKAKGLYNTVLKTKICHDDGCGLEQRVSEVRLSLAGLIFEEFRWSTDPAKKAALLKEMESVKGHDYDLYESHVGVLLAIMSRVLGTATKFQSHLENTFNTCIDGLTDTVGWNDNASFRLLAKVLACLEGMERDALIALSCQFSMVDPSIEPKSGEAEEEGSRTERRGEKNRDAGLRDDASNTSLTNTTLALDKSDQRPIATIAKTTITTEITEIKTPKVHSVSVGMTIRCEDLKGGKDSAHISGNTIEAGSFPDEDLAGARIFCNGECDSMLTRWDHEMYYCIVCASVDLCSSCHSKRLNKKRDEKSSFWRSYCEHDHRYIKGPIKDWRGVKNGVIRFGEEEIRFEQWLKDMRDVRWKKSWERFWQRQGGLRDIEG